MTVNPNTKEIATEAVTESRLDRFARKIVSKRLRNNDMQGVLTIGEGGELFQFGRPGGAESHLDAHIDVRHPAFWRVLWLQGTNGAAESYLRGHWSSPDLTAAIRYAVRNLTTVRRRPLEGSPLWPGQWLQGLRQWLHRNTPQGSRRNIAAHYDLGNEFFELFLDSRMMYSANLYPRADSSLEEAAAHRLDTICQQLELTSQDHLVEIGSGWGGFAAYAAKHYGCRVTTTTISAEQYRYAQRHMREEGVADRVTVLMEDYRRLRGRFDKLVSIEMIEAVGHQFLGKYLRKCADLLNDRGKMLIQAILIPDHRYRQALGEIDFIKRYVFPGGFLPSLAAICQHTSRLTELQIVAVQDITQHYVRTLQHWRENFLSRMQEVQAMGFDERFIRIWTYYLCYCEGAFNERGIGDFLISFAKPGYRSRPVTA